MHVVLGARVDHHQPAWLDDVVVAVVVQDLAVLGQDRRKGHAPALCKGTGFHLSHYFLFDDAQADVLAPDGVHLLSEGSRIVKLRDLAFLLDQPHRDDSLDQSLRSLGFEFPFRNTQQGGQFHGIVVSGRREEMYGPACRQGLSDHCVQLSVRSGMLHADQGCLRSH